MRSQALTLSNGLTVTEVTLDAHGMTAKFLSFGASLQDLRKTGDNHSMVLGYQDASDYLLNGPYLGSVVGPVANRIEGARFHVDGKHFQLDANWLGTHTLHGGRNGTSHCNWALTDLTQDHVTFSLTLSDGHMGFPGPLHLRARYQICENATLDIQLSATCDAPCPINLAPHCYFNLDGARDLRDHRLWIDADRITEVSEQGIPTGRLLETKDTAYDFLTARPAQEVALDTNFCLATANRPLQMVARLSSQYSGRVMDIHTNQPGLQVFNASTLSENTQLKGGQKIRPFAGIAFEPQNWPNAPRLSHFPNSLLRPGEDYLNHSRFIFS